MKHHHRTLLAFLLLSSCYRDGTGCRPDPGDGDDGMEPAGDTCKPGDQECPAAAPVEPTREDLRRADPGER